MSSGGGDSPVEVFWQRYRRLVLRAGVEEGVAVWYRRHVEGFIRFIKPRRLRQANAGDVTQYLLMGHKGVSTTPIYTHVWSKPGMGVKSPPDQKEEGRRQNEGSGDGR